MFRGNPLPDEWVLHCMVMEQIWTRFGKVEVDLFTAQCNSHCLLCFYLAPQDNQPLGMDALARVPWPKKLTLFRHVSISLFLCWTFWCPQSTDRHHGMYSMLADQPWTIPQFWGALSQEGGTVGGLPTLGQPLSSWEGLVAVCSLSKMGTAISALHLVDGFLRASEAFLSASVVIQDICTVCTNLNQESVWAYCLVGEPLLLATHSICSAAMLKALFSEWVSRTYAWQCHGLCHVHSYRSTSWTCHAPSRGLCLLWQHRTGEGKDCGSWCQVCCSWTPFE